MLVLLAGCANGDFGRVKPSLVKDDMHAWVGTEAPGRQGRPPSKFPLTDAERQLRDLAYPLIEPPYDRQRWYSVLAEYRPQRRTSTGPIPIARPMPTKLLATPVRSQNARYARLTEDIRNDVVRVDPFFAVARYVLDMDKKRAQSLSTLRRIEQRMRRTTRARAWPRTLPSSTGCRNRCVHASRLIRLALEQLVVEAPSPMAAEAERSLTLMQTRISACTAACCTPRSPTSALA